MSKFKNLVGLVGLAALGAAVVKELKKPEAERTWEGTLADKIPYDLRVPTLDRLKERCWNPESDSYIAPHVFGVGWSVNVGKIVADVKNSACCKDFGVGSCVSDDAVADGEGAEAADAE